MFTVAWTLVVSICAFSIVLLGQAPLLLSVLGLVLFYGAAIAYDLHCVNESLASQGKQKLKFCTSYGTELFKLRGNLQYQSDVRVKDAKRKSFLSAVTSLQKLEDVSLMSLIRGAESHGEDLVFEKMLDFLSDRVKADGIAIVISQKDSDATQIYKRNLDGRRVSSLLSHLFNWYFSSDENRVRGVVDERSNEKLVGDFSASGINYSVRLPLSLRNGEEKRTALVYFAYKSTVEPSAGELALVNSMVTKLSQEYEAGNTINELERRASELEGSSKAKSDFISHMSHDIRSPLNNIRSILNLFKYEGIGEDNSDMLEVAFANCESLGELVEAILDYSKYSAGRLVARPEIFDLRALVESVLENFAVTAKLKGLELRVRSSSQATAMVMADKKQIRRVLSNLISNAIKYTENGFVEVSLTLQDEINWILQVRDTGVGMTDEQLGKLFSPFTRFKANDADGIGLGLTLTQILLELNKGNVSVSSNPGTGSVFTISIPRYVDSSEAEGLANDFPDALPAASEIISEQLTVFTNKSESEAGLRILLVDDDADCVDTLARSLEMAGHQVFKSISVANAISIYNFELPDVVVTDISMPQGGGKKVIDYITSLPHESRLYVVSGSPKEDAELLSSEVDRVFQKPVDIDELLDELNRQESSESRLVA